MRRGERRPYRAFAGSEEGASAVEFAFLAPVLILLLLGGIELANACFLRSHMAEAARDAARRVAVGALTPAEVEGYVRAKLAGATDAEVRVTVAETEGEFGADVTATAAVPLAELLPFTGGGTSTVEAEREPVGGGPDAAKNEAAGESGGQHKRRGRAPPARPAAAARPAATAAGPAPSSPPP